MAQHRAHRLRSRSQSNPHKGHSHRMSPHRSSSGRRDLGQPQARAAATLPNRPGGTARTEGAGTRPSRSGRTAGSPAHARQASHGVRVAVLAGSRPVPGCADRRRPRHGRNRLRHDVRLASGPECSGGTWPRPEHRHHRPRRPRPRQALRRAEPQRPAAREDPDHPAEGGHLDRGPAILRARGRRSARHRSSDLHRRRAAAQGPGRLHHHPAVREAGVRGRRELAQA